MLKRLRIDTCRYQSHSEYLWTTTKEILDPCNDLSFKINPMFTLHAKALIEVSDSLTVLGSI